MIKQVAAIVVAAGIGERYGAPVPKQWLDLGGWPIWMHSVFTLLGEAQIARLIIVFSKKQLIEMERCIPPFIKQHPMCILVEGGTTRAESVKRGLDVVQENWVLIHDAVRPGLTRVDLKRLWQAAGEGGSDAFVLGIPVGDTLARVDDNTHRLIGHLSRAQCWRIFTPQLFRAVDLRTAFSSVPKQGTEYPFNDESELIQSAGLTCQIVRGSPLNLKVTYPEDLELLKRLQPHPLPLGEEQASLRIGHGFDLHSFEGDKPLRLGGIEIADAPCVKAHSDGDLLIHALIDALLGAAGLGDIGTWFPDHDPRFSSVSGSHLLTETCSIISRERGAFSISNIDVVVFLERPRLSVYRKKIVESLASLLQLSVTQINFKATTLEGQGAVGAGAAVAAEAVVLMRLSSLSRYV